jgi:V/A-type H+-transporting ATPase subunit G/H
MVAKAEAKAKEEADCIVANENKKVAEVSSLAKVKILSIRLEDVMQFE